jgi:hypothetical protein
MTAILRYWLRGGRETRGGGGTGGRFAGEERVDVRCDEAGVPFTLLLAECEVCRSKLPRGLALSVDSSMVLSGI